MFDVEEFDKLAKRNRSKIVKLLDFNQIKDALEPDILTEQAYDRIERLFDKSAPDAHGKLLDILSKRSDDSKEAFYNLLIDEGQAKVANLLQPGGKKVTTKKRSRKDEESSSDSSRSPSPQRKKKRTRQESISDEEVTSSKPEPTTAKGDQTKNKGKGAKASRRKGHGDSSDTPRARAQSEYEGKPRFQGVDESDEPIIVEKSTKEFYDLHKEKAYPIGKGSTGMALIFNIKHLKGTDLERTGTDKDRDRLEQLWQGMGFKVTVENDEKDDDDNIILGKEDILVKTKKFFDKAGKSKAWCTIVCILAHGDKGGQILARDREVVLLDQIYEKCDAKHCKGLIDRPKLFFIQACRGDNKDKAKKKAKDEDDTNKKPDSCVKIPYKADTLFAFPCQEGYVSKRNTIEGSWFMQEIVTVFKKSAAENNICSLLTMVNKNIKEKPTKENKDQMQMSQFNSALTKEIYFFPGINGNNSS